MIVMPLLASQDGSGNVRRPGVDGHFQVFTPGFTSFQCFIVEVRGEGRRADGSLMSQGLWAKGIRDAEIGLTLDWKKHSRTRKSRDISCLT